MVITNNSHTDNKTRVLPPPPPPCEPAGMLLGSCWGRVELLPRLCQLGLLPKGIYVCSTDTGGGVWGRGGL